MEFTLDILVDGLRLLRVPDSATGMVSAVARHLERFGWTVTREAGVSDRGDGRPGRVDLYAYFAYRPGLWIECDRETPREKSIAKLLGCNGDRLILLRGSTADEWREQGRVRVLGLPIVEPS